MLYCKQENGKSALSPQIANIDACFLMMVTMVSPTVITSFEKKKKTELLRYELQKVI